MKRIHLPPERFDVQLRKEPNDKTLPPSWVTLVSDIDGDTAQRTINNMRSKYPHETYRLKPR